MLPFMRMWGASRPDGLLIVVCAAFAVAVLASLPLTFAPGWDEIVYLSRFGPYAPATPFSAPRSRGVPLLVAPVAAGSDAVVVLRCYLAVAAALALYLGFRPWTRVFGGPVVPAVAAAAYGSGWLAVFYAGAAMPNHYLAMAAVGAVGCFLLATAPVVPASHGPGRPWRAARPIGPLVGLAGALGVAALMRPNDAVWLAVPLLLAALAVPAWRRPAPAVAITTGLAAGLVPWAIEAQVRFGGVRQRLHEAGAIQGGTRPTFSLPEYLTTLDGPLLCRPCTADSVTWSATVWWLLLPPLVALGLYAAHRAGRTPEVWLPVVVAVSVSATYLGFIDYAAPRFLLPAYALLAIPVALGVTAVVRRAWPAGAPVRDAGPRPARTRADAGRWLRAGAVTLVLAVIATAHGTVQWRTLRHHVRVQEQARADWQRIADVLHAQGVRPPCLLGGSQAVVPIAHAAGCRSQRDTPDGRESGGGVPDAFVLRGRHRPAWTRGWPVHRVPGAERRGWRVAVAPPGGHRAD